MRTTLSAVVFLLFSIVASAQPVHPLTDDGAGPNPNYLAEIELNTVDELAGVLRRAEKLFHNGQFSPDRDTPIAFVLLGAEARLLLHKNYRRYRELVDLAAKLTAFQVVDIKVCRTWMGGELVHIDELPPFVGTVPHGPTEKLRLLEEQGYVYF